MAHPRYLLLLLLTLAAPHLPAQSLHAYLIIDRADAAIGAPIDERVLTTWLHQSAQLAGLRLQLHTLDQHGPQGSWFYQHSRQLSPGPDDVVFVYFSGHGTSTCSSQPAFRMPGNFCFSQQQVHSRLAAKGPRLLITMYDCCTQRDTIQSPLRVIQPPELSEEQRQNARALWRDYRGDIRLQSNDPRYSDVSYGNPDHGGLYTDTFIGLYRRLLGAEPYDCTWEAIAVQTRLDVARYAQLNQKTQVPQHWIDLRPLRLPLNPRTH